MSKWCLWTVRPHWVVCWLGLQCPEGSWFVHWVRIVKNCWKEQPAYKCVYQARSMPLTMPLAQRFGSLTSLFLQSKNQISLTRKDRLAFRGTRSTKSWQSALSTVSHFPGRICSAERTNLWSAVCQHPTECRLQLLPGPQLYPACPNRSLLIRRSQVR